MAEIELKPCPFCGGEKVSIDRDIPSSKIFPRWYIKCEKCGRVTLSYPVMQALVAIYNNRPSEQEG